MAIQSIEELYETHIKPLPAVARLQLLALTAQDLAQQPVEPDKKSLRNIMELHGLGKEIWEGVDVQAYINALRDEWNERL